MATLKGMLDVLGTVGVAAAVGVMVAKGMAKPEDPHAAPPPLPKTPVSVEGAHVRGKRTAPVAVLEFSDFECPYCAVFAREVLPELDKTYLGTGRAFLAVRQMPLSIHAMAKPLAEAAVCAGKHDRFWQLHEWVFTRPTTPDMAAVTLQAQAYGLDKQDFLGCVANDAPPLVDSDLAHARALGVTGTPTFFVGRVREDGRIHVTSRLVGSQQMASFAKAIDAAAQERGAQ